MEEVQAWLEGKLDEPTNLEAEAGNEGEDFEGDDTSDVVVEGIFPNKHARRGKRINRRLAKRGRNTIEEITTTGKASRVSEVVLNTRFTLSRSTVAGHNVRLPIPDKRKLAPKEKKLPPHVAAVMAQEHHVALMDADVDVHVRRQELRDGAKVEALLKEARGN